MLPFNKMWKKNIGHFLAIPVILFLLAAIFSPAGQIKVFADTQSKQSQIGVYLNGTALQFDVLPRFQQGMPVFPLRKIFEESGYSVTWEAEAKRAVLKGAGRIVVLYPQNPLYSVNGVVYRMSVPPFIERGRLMVGLDFIQECTAFENPVWDETNGILYLKYRNGQESDNELPPPGGAKNGYQPYNFVEVLLPPGNRTRVGESFEIVIAAPFVKDIYSYEVSFFYNPEVIKIKDVRNYSYKPQEEFYLKRINNMEGMLKYTQTSLGYREEIPPRSHFVVIEAIAFREGAVPFLEGNLKVVLLDNKAKQIPVALEEKTLYIQSSPAR